MTAQTFPERLIVGRDFEPHVVEVLKRELAWDIGLYESKAEQWEHGESRGRVEIKFDRNIRETGNLFVETKERRDDSGMSSWRPSGIYDEHDPWFYAIGDEQTVWLFATSLLKLLHQTRRYRYVLLNTSEGFILSMADADKYCVRRIEEEI